MALNRVDTMLELREFMAAYQATSSGMFEDKLAEIAKARADLDSTISDLTSAQGVTEYKRVTEAQMEVVKQQAADAMQTAQDTQTKADKLLVSLQEQAEQFQKEQDSFASMKKEFMSTYKAKQKELADREAAVATSEADFKAKMDAHASAMADLEAREAHYEARVAALEMAIKG